MEEFRESTGRVGGFIAGLEVPASENMILGPDPSSTVIFVSGVRLLVNRLADECRVSDGRVGAMVGDSVLMSLDSLDSVSGSSSGTLLAVRLEDSVGAGPGRLSVTGNAGSELMAPYPDDAAAVEGCRRGIESDVEVRPVIMSPRLFLRLTDLRCVLPDSSKLCPLARLATSLKSASDEVIDSLSSSLE